MGTINIPQDRQRHFFWLGLIVLALTEVLAVSLLADARNIANINSAAFFLSYAGDALKFLITSSAIFALFLIRDRAVINTILFEGASYRRFLWAMPLHLLSFILFLLITIRVFNSDTSASGLQMTAWLCFVITTGLTFTLLVASAARLGRLLKHQKIALLISIGGGLSVMLISLYSRALWEPLSELTMYGSHLILNIVYNDIYIDASAKLLGAQDFVVHVSPQCSGIDGMALAVGITSAYLFLSRNNMRFPHAILLIPIAAVLAVLFNIVRVAVLVAIGASISEQIAIEGFHSVGGWISSILIAMLIIFVFANWTAFHPKTQQKTQKIIDKNEEEESNLAIAILVPFVIFLGVTIVARIFTYEFDTAYPLKIAIALPAIFFFWRTYKLRFPLPWLEHVAIGLLVAFLWVLLIPSDAAGNTEFQQHLLALPAWATIIWISFRLVGFWIFAPVVEELVFRGYLLNRLSGEKLRTEGVVAFSVTGFLVSSLLFGVIHADWVAGSLAGACFALSRYRSTHIGGPIVAHAAANIFVSIWAFSTGEWLLI